MSGPARFNAQLIFLDRGEVAGEVRAYAELSRIALSDILRDSFGRSWPKVRAGLRAEYGHPSGRQVLVGTLLSLRGGAREAFRIKHNMPADTTAGELWAWAEQREAE